MAKAVGAAVGTALVVFVFVWLLLQWIGPAGGGERAASGEPPTVDVAVENVVTPLRDGRLARGSFVLRMNENGMPDKLIEAARKGSLRPTPIPPRVGEQSNRSTTGQIASPQALVVERVGEAMSSLSYEETAGEAGKQRLREQVRATVNGALPEAPVREVFIINYLVQ